MTTDDHSDLRRSLGATLRALRLKNGWTQERIAELVGDGMTQSDVSQLERGRVGLPRRARLDRIASALGVSSGELLARSGWAQADEFLIDLGTVEAGGAVASTETATAHPISGTAAPAMTGSARAMTDAEVRAALPVVLDQLDSIDREVMLATARELVLAAARRAMVEQPTPVSEGRETGQTRATQSNSGSRR